MKIFTVGYNGLSVDQFVSILDRLGVQTLIDIRERPISRKPGFSKSKLNDRLLAVGIDYQHLRALGSPKELRLEYRGSGNTHRFFDSLSHVFKAPQAVDQLHEVVQIATHQTACLMCCCADWMYCHRKAVIDQLVELHPFDVGHILWTPNPGTAIVQTVAISTVYAA